MIDIIITTYKRKKILESILESIVSLKKKLKVGCKVYVVDDASNYDYSEFEKVFKGDDFILEILEINQDPGPERNRGLEDSSMDTLLVSLRHLQTYM